MDAMRLAGLVLTTAACALPAGANPPAAALVSVAAAASDPAPPPAISEPPPAPAICEPAGEAAREADQPDSAEPLAPPAFEPTAFSVEVNGHGRPVILIPGLASPGTVWRDTVAHFEGNETHVLTLAGFAGRPAIAGPLIATARAELAAYIRERKLDHPIVVGHSLGAALAYGLAVDEPDLVGPIVAIDEPLGWCDADSIASARVHRDRWLRLSPRDFAQAIRELFAPMARDPAMLAPIVADAIRSDQRAVGDASYELCATDLRPQASRFTAPVLAILADGPYQWLIRSQLAAVPEHVIVVIPRARHFVMLDEPRAFFDALDTFLAAHPRP
jgi:pimeloyl-ACP methyl ester carboxylesterase